jgi:hypothetical protein
MRAGVVTLAAALTVKLFASSAPRDRAKGVKRGGVARDGETDFAQQVALQ